VGKPCLETYIVLKYLNVWYLTKHIFLGSTCIGCISNCLVCNSYKFIKCESDREYDK